MKSREEVEKLKQNWAQDPCWDLPETDGFGEYVLELREYQHQKEAEWDAARIKHHDKLLSMACPLSFVWVDYGKDDRGHNWWNCLVEKCAWWNEAKDCCVIRALTLK